MSRILKLGIYAASLAVSAFVGDCCDVCDRFVYPVYYGDTLVAEGFYKRPFSLRKEYRVRDGYLEVYFGDEEAYPVSDGLHVNERSIGGKLKDGTKGMLRGLGRKVGEALDSVDELKHDFYRGIEDD